MAIDLGKYKSVVCLYRNADDTRFHTFPTSREEVYRVLDRHRPAVVLIEACLLASWVHDRCVEPTGHTNSITAGLHAHG